MRAVISELHGVDEMRELERLFADIWERPGEPPLNSGTLRALAHAGNYVVGARERGGRLVGGLVGWFGGLPPGELHLHSHILGVAPGSQVGGLGFELKQHQRGWCLERGVKLVEWTFDPLVRRNAYFNLTKLGAEARGYLVNFYGTMTDGINAGEESDRLLISWRLDSGRARDAADGRLAEPAVEELLLRDAAIVLSVGQAQEPVAGKLGTPVVLCQVPADIVALRRSDAGAARAWRLAVRKALTSAFAVGYEMSGATRSGWYVLSR